MAQNNPFARAKTMMAAVASIMAMSSGIAAQTQIASLGPYVSRGKGKGLGNQRPAGAGMAAHRAAHKARNVKRHRARLKGARA